MDIYDYARNPLKEDWQKICGEKVEVINNLGLSDPKRKFNVLNLFDGYHGINLSYWIREFNNRIFDLITNYTLLKSYYDAGIPDEEWYKSPGDNGESIQYFPHFKEEHFGNLYWFSFYMDSYYTRFEGVIDSVYHLVNVKYQFDVETTLGFRIRVMKKLKTKDSDLYAYLNSLPENPVFKEIKDFRNNIVHNFRPNQVDSGLSKTKNEDGSTTYSMGIGNYTSSSEFLNNINESLDLLLEITDKIREKVSLSE
ncbi:Cthe_2314 family HEPN domain-containing protein [Paenibacillus ottowii]|uniref:Cthe-2314-like HEPN domain-containing protein n=1 Tax=Paenibacillus ottowii TaxID=2315729 RepID=A0ABY3B7L8_9BACL|nr:Cthe_2314 family HEPN domain-containing protein [Paenibacillus ottowii]TQS00066.1 hypothetical protein FKV70_04600 [Paenibacillus ottowii]TQS00135.1 hypothetical protein FKV70_04975 [Paenibacillus ottowii]